GKRLGYPGRPRGDGTAAPGALCVNGTSVVDRVDPGPAPARGAGRSWATTSEKGPGSVRQGRGASRAAIALSVWAALRGGSRSATSERLMTPWRIPFLSVITSLDI